MLQVMTAEVGKASNNGEEVLALKKFISKCNLDNEKLKDVIAVNKSRDDFLLKFRCALLRAMSAAMSCAALAPGKSPQPLSVFSQQSSALATAVTACCTLMA